jgi:hypothetical protein
MNGIIKIGTFLGLLTITAACNGGGFSESELKSIKDYTFPRIRGQVDKNSMKITNCKKGKSAEDYTNPRNGITTINTNVVTCDISYINEYGKYNSVLNLEFGYSSKDSSHILSRLSIKVKK